jgi:hypothetical protein
MAAEEGYTPKTSRIREKTKPDFQVFGQIPGREKVMIRSQIVTIQLHSEKASKTPL